MPKESATRRTKKVETYRVFSEADLLRLRCPLATINALRKAA